jgi:glutamate N-acetyltransferase/amino-acid N-acetyltransferase
MANETITAAKGFRASGVACGIKPSGRLDVGLLVGEVRCAAAGLFTTNRFCGAPVVVARRHVRQGWLRAVVVNSGNANVANGPRGLRDAEQMCRRVAEHMGVKAEEVLPGSTGVIGRPLPMENVVAGIDQAFEALSAGMRGGRAFARAILTTDSRTKEAARRVRLGRADVVIVGCAKGSGMIAPHLATTLSYIATDAGIRPGVLRAALRGAAEATLNRITVDECTSTSDMTVVLASGLAENEVVGTLGSRWGRAFGEALHEVCEELAYQIVADGEGATRVIEVTVRGARTGADAHAVARAVAVSPLLKAAVYGGDPNWGRVIQAVGMTRAVFDPARVTVRFGGQVIFARSGGNLRVDGRALREAMTAEPVRIQIDLGAGRAEDRVLTCDLSEEYVRVNAQYTT